MRAKGDKTDSIKIEAQSTLRYIVSKFNHPSFEDKDQLNEILENLSRN